MARLNARSLLTWTSSGSTMPRQSRQSTCESKSGSSNTTGVGRTGHSGLTRGSLGGKTPVDRIADLGEITPLTAEVESAYDERKERIRHRKWRVDKILGEHHRRASEPVFPTGATGSDAPKKRPSKSETMSANRTVNNNTLTHREACFSDRNVRPRPAWPRFCQSSLLPAIRMAGVSVPGSPCRSPLRCASTCQQLCSLPEPSRWSGLRSFGITSREDVGHTAD